MFVTFEVLDPPNSGAFDDLLDAKAIGIVACELGIVRGEPEEICFTFEVLSVVQAEDGLRHILGVTTTVSGVASTVNIKLSDDPNFPALMTMPIPSLPPDF